VLYHLLSDKNSEVLRKFPNLVMLDLEPVAKIQFDVPAVDRSVSTGPDFQAAATFPVHMEPAVVAGGVGPLIAEFLNK